ncbi:putative metal-binding motif-containing protein [Corallococcus sp. M34]|uniref:putative metal-binding motif-containing protein n=1 Tax=Citreicoccus inhibens TaxID=2849499 RepID=UPI001C222510|nr:putative metal-binding motif-containing protein [Citreicoccus inhibens]MBU8894646.1 putative metal-binding motif-containing protein [Citreicoccus inhibens]
MRLFLLGLLCVSMAACKREPKDDPRTGALRVLVFYATFRPACLTLTARDVADTSREAHTPISVDATRQSDTRMVAVFRQQGWSQDLRLTVQARERSCAGPVVAEQTVTATVPREGRLDVEMDLRAEDLDDDGFISTAQGGTDCDDTRADVNPEAPEVCDGVDNNCSQGEADASGNQLWYVDRDGDGYGTTPFPACGRPANAAAQGGDCDDSDASIHPGQEETRCDGVDENCDGTKDEPFRVGQACVTEQQCPGTYACAASGLASACLGSQSPQAWFVDEDGDGRAGTSTAPSCVSPAPGATHVSEDCDESSRFVAQGLSEVCDRMDNDCDGHVDSASCVLTWAPLANAPATSTRWNAVAAYGAGKAWFAGEEQQLLDVDGAASTPLTCAGNWRSAWATASGRVFLGADDGRIATRTATEDCAVVSLAGMSASINGLVGFEAGNGTTLYAVTSSGRVLRWDYPSAAAPVEVANLGVNLRAIHGAPGPQTLLAVGALDQGVDSPQPRAFRFDVATGSWTSEALGNTGAGFLRGVHVVDARTAYAVGDQGLVLERANGAWRMLPRLTDATGTPRDATGVVAYGRHAIYAVASDGEVRFSDGGAAWVTAYRGVTGLTAIDGPTPTEIWASGQQGTLVRFHP